MADISHATSALRGSQSMRLGLARLLNAEMKRFSQISARSEIQAGVALEHPVHICSDVEIQRGSSLGAFTFVNKRTSIYEKVRIGRFCSIGRGAEIGAPSHPTNFLSTHQFQFTNAEFPNYPDYCGLQSATWADCEPTTIGNDVWIGSGAIVKTGLTVGDGAVVGANAVVTRSVPPYAIVAGNPSRFLRLRHSNDHVGRLAHLRWWDLPIEALKGLPFSDIEACIKALEQLSPKDT